LKHCLSSLIGKGRLEVEYCLDWRVRKARPDVQGSATAGHGKRKTFSTPQINISTCWRTSVIGNLPDQSKNYG
jgi:hypothetical protein